jgi:hypothetical protein
MDNTFIYLMSLVTTIIIVAFLIDMYFEGKK